MLKKTTAIALVLMLLTGLALGQMRTLGPNAAPAQAFRSNAAAALSASAFYDAVNRFLATGNPDRLLSLLQPGFMNHNELAEEPDGAEGLLRYLDSLRQTFPSARLGASLVSSNGDLAAFNVSLQGDINGHLLGIPVEMPTHREGYELIRVDDDRIAERWSGQQLPGKFETLAEWSEANALDVATTSSIEPIVIPSNASLKLDFRTSSILPVESGTVSIAPVIDRTAASTPTVQPAIHLRSGDVASVHEVGSHQVANTDTRTASVILLSVKRVAGELASTPAFRNSPQINASKEITRLTLAGSFRVPDVREALNVSFGRAILPPGTQISRHEVSGSEMLVVQQGSIEVTAENCDVQCVMTAEGLSRTYSNQIILQPDQSASAGPGTEITYRVNGLVPATVWLVTLTTRKEPGG